MATQEVPVKANLNIVLKSDTEQLEEVMVVAYGTAKKSAFTGSAATIKNEKIATRQTSNVTNALAGASNSMDFTVLCRKICRRKNPKRHPVPPGRVEACLISGQK